jgi:hypothetical protein
MIENWVGVTDVKVVSLMVGSRNIPLVFTMLRAAHAMHKVPEG